MLWSNSMNFDQVMGNLEQLFAAELGYLHRVVNPYEMESETTVSNKIKLSLYLRVHLN
uniref:AlNc14C470G11838 protein n=1 Tax=Albugo laibachii Nc14 TaxID=890382 RepID=F0X0A2_9STRA|nr:AlNc14C470G11838 [Albugo laibachii Nc14]|eukprot:CCA27184.1 AlNc14C470G11838 [Albugo laibachii Nc14]